MRGIAGFPSSANYNGLNRIVTDTETQVKAPSVGFS